MRTPVAMPARKGHTPAEVAGFHADRDKEHAKLRELVQNAIGMLGLPKLAVEVLKVGAPVLVDVASMFDRALHPESPGGASLTHDELVQIAHGAARELEHRILDELAHLVTEPVQATPAPVPPSPTPIPTAALPAPAPVPTIDPAVLAAALAAQAAAQPAVSPPPGVPPKAA